MAASFWGELKLFHLIPSTRFRVAGTWGVGGRIGGAGGGREEEVGITGSQFPVQMAINVSNE